MLDDQQNVQNIRIARVVNAKLVLADVDFGRTAVKVMHSRAHTCH